ncbi:MAG: hypothetical protein ACPL3B_05570 [Fervidobacterium sp.]
MEIEIYLRGNEITIKKVVHCSFPFLIETDSEGCSYITFEDGKYYICNRLSGKIIKKKEIPLSEVKKIIKEVTIELSER